MSDDFEKPAKRKNTWWQWGTVLIAILIIAFLGTLIFLVNTKTAGGLFSQNPLKKHLVANKLDATAVSAESASRHPLAVIVENHPDARPQYGLNKASIVYEAITEGGITRFLAIFGPNEAEKVGPIRSARTYFIDWLSEYNAYFAHVGGNLDALEQIKSDRIYDLDQFGLGAPTYWRSPRPGIAIEHTMFSDTKLLYKAAGNRDYPSDNSFTSLKFRNPAKPDPSSQQTSQQITIDFSDTSYKVVWAYDVNTNSYLRSEGGSPHLDGATGQQLSAKNVIIQEVSRQDAPTAIGEQGWAMQTTGTGNAKIFIEGKKIDGTWKKPSRTDRTKFYDAGGNEIKFIPGAFWYEITPPTIYSNITVN